MYQIKKTVADLEKPADQWIRSTLFVMQPMNQSLCKPFLKGGYQKFHNQNKQVADLEKPADQWIRSTLFVMQPMNQLLCKPFLKVGTKKFLNKNIHVLCGYSKELSQ